MADGRWRQAAASLLVPFAILVVGAMAGSVGTYALVKPVLGKPGLPKRPPRPRGLPEAAVVTAPMAESWEGQVQVAWRVTNTGATTWVPHEYRFVPAAGGLPVVSLPGRVAPGGTATVRTVLTVSALAPGRMAWQLVGPEGAVRGAYLEVEIGPRAPTAGG